MNKATITIAVFIILLVGGLIFWRAGSLQAPAPNEPASETVEEETTDTGSQTGGLVPMVSIEALGAHNTASDCWIAYKGTVYDVTDWLTKHPGGSNAIAQYCGTSEEFEVAFEGQHGAKQQNMLPEVGVFIGTLGVIEGAQS